MAGLARLGIARLGAAYSGVARLGIAGRPLWGAFDPSQLNPLQYLYDFLAPSTAVDKTANALNADYVDSPHLTWDGVDSLTVTGLTGSNVVACSGTSTPTAGTDEITFTAGTCWDITIDGVLVYPAQEFSGVTVSSIVKPSWPDAQIAGTLATVRVGTQSESHYFAENGGSKVLSFDGTGYAYTEEVSSIVSDSSGAFSSWVKPNLGATMYHGAVSRLGVGVDFVSAARLSSTGEVTGYFSNNNAPDTFLTTGVNVPDGEWSHIIFQSTGSEYEIWLNGVNLTLTATSGANDGDWIDAFSAPPTALAIGGLLGGIPSVLFDGEIGDVCYYSAPLSPSEIAEIYAVGCKDGATFEYRPSRAYGTTLPNSAYPTGATDATLVNADFLYLPALAGGTDDVAGLGITNTGGIIHNWGPHKIQQDVANTEFLDNPFWSADGINYDKKSPVDFVNHANFDENVVIKWDENCFVADILTWEQAYGWTPAAYQLMVNWLGDVCYSGNLIPYPVTAGTGIGPSLGWYTPDGTNIYLVEDA